MKHLVYLFTACIGLTCTAPICAASDPPDLQTLADRFVESELAPGIRPLEVVGPYVLGFLTRTPENAPGSV